MTKEDTYNGWSNYETWLVALHFDNEYSIYKAVSSIIGAEDFLQMVKTDKIKAVFTIASVIKDWVLRNERSPVMKDLYSHGCDIDEINYMEIADNEIVGRIDDYVSIYD